MAIKALIESTNKEIEKSKEIVAFTDALIAEMKALDDDKRILKSLRLAHVMKLTGYD